MVAARDPDLSRTKEAFDDNNNMDFSEGEEDLTVGFR